MLLTPEFWSGSSRRKRCRRVATVLVGVSFLLGLSRISLGRENESKSTNVVGVATKVESALLVVRAADGTEVTLTPLEDFTKKVAVGSKVTASYYLQGSIKVLERLEYSAQNASLSPTGIRSSIRKVILLPSSAVPGADGVFEAVERYLRSSFGWYVAPRVLAEELRNRTATSGSTLEALNTETGDFDMTHYLGARQNLVSQLASETRVDAVLEVNIEEVTAQVRRMVASWDGVEESVGGKGSRTVAKFAIVPGKGYVAASTMVLKLWDARGRLLWSSRRGLAILGVHEGLGGKLRNRPLTEYLQDSASVEKWLATTFASLSE